MHCRTSSAHSKLRYRVPNCLRAYAHHKPSPNTGVAEEAAEMATAEDATVAAENSATAMTKEEAKRPKAKDVTTIAATTNGKRKAASHMANPTTDLLPKNAHPKMVLDASPNKHEL